MTVPNMGRNTKPVHDASAAPATGRESTGADIVQMPRETLQGMIHDLRNQLNTILMNAGVAARMCEDRERVARYVAQFEKEGERCAETLQAISDEYL